MADQREDITDEFIDLSKELLGLMLDLGRRRGDTKTIPLVRAVAMASLNLNVMLALKGQELEAVKLHREFVNFLCDQVAEAIVTKAPGEVVEFVNEDDA